MDAGEDASTQPSQPTDTNHPLYPTPHRGSLGLKPSVVAMCKRSIVRTNDTIKRHFVDYHRRPITTHPHHNHTRTHGKQSE
jgi:hypothetical protein